MGEMAENISQNTLVYPKDRRIRVYVNLKLVTLALLLGILPVIAAWLWWWFLGLPELNPISQIPDTSEDNPIGFPVWLRVAHFVNLFLMIMLIRSGLSILMDHPRLYWNDHCTSGSEWIRFTPHVVPTDRVWTAKDDSRYISPWIALPGFRHTIGIARHWHFLSAFFWFMNGLVFVGLLFATNQWKRLVPRDTEIFMEAWKVFVHYSTFHMPIEPDGFYKYNPLQQLSYFGVVFVVAPVSFLTGLAMSPAIDNWAGWYPRLFGGRQSARSIHFLAMCSYLAFLVPHVGMVVLTGLCQNMNHIIFGTDDRGAEGLVLFLVGVAAIVGFCYLAHWISWQKPRWVQLGFRYLLGPIQSQLLNRLPSRNKYSRRDISPYFWPNGKLPHCLEWEGLGELRRKGFTLRVHGLVKEPKDFSIEALENLGKREQITLHHCIQGWSGVAQWGGITLTQLMDCVKPLPTAKVVVFRSFGEGHYGGEYYDTLSIENARHPETLLAYEMNDKPLSDLHGAPLRLRAENQLGYKMVKWIKSIEFVESIKDVGKGFGGKNEDDEYYPVVANI
jgi:thiosulfate reductase cytochrome b subunit